MIDKNHKKKWLESRKNRLKYQVDDLLAGILGGSKNALSQALTLVESNRKEDLLLSEELVRKILPYTGNSIRIGITGVPGVGKSTFIESFGLKALSQGKKIAVLAIDPSSEQSKGSILGDKTRMNQLSMQENVFIRPSPSNGALGGVAKRTRESILLCEAFGYDIVIVETVGVGQSEVIVKEMVDFFLLLMLSGAGDELQGIKRGIMEMADAIVITKADGENVSAAKVARRNYQNALHLFQAKKSMWIPKARVCSAYDGNGINEVWELILAFYELTNSKGFFLLNRKEQEMYWLNENMKNLVLEHFYSSASTKKAIDNAKKKIKNNNSDAFSLSRKIVEAYLSKNNNETK